MEAVLTDISVRPAVKRLNLFEKYLTIWVGLCMVGGVALGKWAPYVVPLFRDLEFGTDSHINVPIAVLIWLMVVPMMMRIDSASVRNVGRKPKGLFITCQLGREALFNGISRVAFLPTPVCIMDFALRGRSIHRRDHHLGRGSLDLCVSGGQHYREICSCAFDCRTNSCAGLFQLFTGLWIDEVVERSPTRWRHSEPSLEPAISLNWLSRRRSRCLALSPARHWRPSSVCWSRCR